MARDGCICYFLFWAIAFLLPPLPSPNSPKNEIFQKMKKNSGDIIILHECTKSHDHMLYWSWDMACDRCHCYFSFQAIFWPFIPLTAEKIKISKKWENCLEISSFYTWVPKIIIRGYVWLLRYGAQQMDRQMNRWADG